MAKTKREIIFLTFVISCVATVLTIVSIATNEWIVSELKLVAEPGKKGYVHYGLFNGIFENRIFATTISNDIAVACIFDENICGYSNALTKERRETELKDVLDGRTCLKSKILRKSERNIYFDDNIFGLKLQDVDVTSTSSSTDSDDSTTVPGIVICELTFLNAGLWLTTIILMMLSTLFGGISAFFSVVNTSTNPVSHWNNIWGLYIWNSIAASSHLLAMVLWGAHFESYIKYNVAITETLRGVFTSNGLANLGYSYWIIFPSMMLHLINIGLFYLRQYLINKEPPVPTLEHNFENDGMIFVY